MPTPLWRLSPLLLLGISTGGCSLLIDFATGLPCEAADHCPDGFRCLQGACAASDGEPVCGDFVVEGSEECDDGNTADGDGCLSDCTLLRCDDGSLPGTTTNCGACGHDCLDGVCYEQTCRGTVLVQEANNPYDLDVNDTHVFFASYGDSDTLWDGSVRRVDKNGSGETFLHSSDASVYDVKIDAAASKLYWVSQIDSYGIVSRANLDGTGYEELAVNLAGPERLAMSANQVFWVQKSSQNGQPLLAAINKSGGDAFGVAVCLSRGNDVTLNSGDLYWVEENGLLRRLEPGSSPENLVTDARSPRAITADATHVYWAEVGTFAQSYDDGRIRRYAVSSGIVQPLADLRDAPDGIAVDDTHVYWTESNGVFRRAKDGTGPIEQISADGADEITLDATHLYYLSADRVVKANKNMRAHPPTATP